MKELYEKLRMSLITTAVSTETGISGNSGKAAIVKELVCYVLNASEMRLICPLSIHWSRVRTQRPRAGQCGPAQAFRAVCSQGGGAGGAAPQQPELLARAASCRAGGAGCCLCCTWAPTASAFTLRTHR